jgi:hypothetical protein
MVRLGYEKRIECRSVLSRLDSDHRFRDYVIKPPFSLVQDCHVHGGSHSCTPPRTTQNVPGGHSDWPSGQALTAPPGEDCTQTSLPSVVVVHVHGVLLALAAGQQLLPVGVPAAAGQQALDVGQVFMHVPEAGSHWLHGGHVSTHDGVAPPAEMQSWHAAQQVGPLAPGHGALPSGQRHWQVVVPGTPWQVVPGGHGGHVLTHVPEVVSHLVHTDAH